MRIISAYIALLLSTSLVAQEVYTNDVLVRTGYGALVPHRSIMHHMVTGHACFAEVSYQFNSYGQHNFDTPFLMPSAGISGLFLNSGNSEMIGNCYGIYTYFALPISKKKFIPKIKMGTGLGYVQKPFDIKTNTKNVAIGSHLNTCIVVELFNNVTLSEKFSLNYGIAMIHFSNGSFSSPNLGLNFLTANLGASYALGEKKEIKHSEKLNYDKSWKYNVWLSGGVRSNSTHHQEKYPAYTLTTETIKRVSTKSQLLFGLDFFYNTSIEHLDEYEHLKENVDYLKSSSNFQLGTYFGYGLVFDKLTINIINGFYLRNEFKERSILYHRVSIRRKITEKLTLALGLKSHFGVAEYAELGIGYTF
ncbi:MAG: acyloxyacyl hydrolase [Bacteroidia bacterium]